MKTEWQTDLIDAFDKHFPLGRSEDKKQLFQKVEGVCIKIIRTMMAEAEKEQVDEVRPGAA